ncbi:hypothetical protein T12_11826, partial [Trichinella patagoniensis]
LGSSGSNRGSSQQSAPLGDGPQFITEPMLAQEELAICSAG